MSKTTTFQLKVVIIDSKELMVGFGTRDVFGNSTIYTHKEFQGYKFSQNIFENGLSRSVPSNLEIANGSSLSIKINRTENVVIWNMGGSQLAKANIPEIMRNKPLFLILICFNKNEELELLIDQ